MKNIGKFTIIIFTILLEKKLYGTQFISVECAK